MISFLRTWANQIIIAIIIATILEMLLPKGNNKKYIHMVIGFYILFVIIQPILSKLTGKNITIEDFQYQKYLQESTMTTGADSFEKNNAKLIQKAYLENIKNDIQTKLEQKGYSIVQENLQINDKEGEHYGMIEKITLTLKRKSEPSKPLENNHLSISIQEVDIQVTKNSVTNSQVEENKISDKEKEEIKEYLANTYSIAKNNIALN